MFLFPLAIYLEVELLGYMATLFLIFCRTARLFSNVVLEFIDDFTLLLTKQAACLALLGKG